MRPNPRNLRRSPLVTALLGNLPEDIAAAPPPDDTLAPEPEPPAGPGPNRRQRRAQTAQLRRLLKAIR